jgi:glucose 1-dehydrogenase
VDLGNHCAVVTGGESGIGKACAIALGRVGVPVVLTYFVDATLAAAVVAEIEAAGGRALAQQADVGQETAVNALFSAAEEAFGPVTMLVNSAGLNMRGTPLAQTSLAQFDAILRSDLYGPFLTCRRFVRGLAGRQGGRIVNISSIHAFAPRAGAVDYDSAKGGLTQLTTTLALELAPQKIAVNAVAPGMILTPMNASAIADPVELKTKEAAIPWGRAGTAEEVAETVLFLLSPQADYITGATLVIDGGLSLTVAQGA